MSEPLKRVCPRCQSPLPSPDTLACPACGTLLYGAELEKIAAEARWQEHYNRAQAIALWETCLKLLPPQSRQYETVQAEISRLKALPPMSQAVAEPGSMPIVRQEKWPLAALKTGLSMIVSILVYQFNFGWAGAIGFVLLILVHEMGHVVANLYYGLPASPPIFIPYIGAVINLRRNPPNARVEAIVGIAGPVAGTIGALACLGWYGATHNPLALVLSWFGFYMNLFNLLPVPPLDGGRVAAAISPWIWVIGLGGLGFMLFEEFQHGGGSGILIVVLIVALPRIIKTLKPSGRSGPYYAIGRTAPVVIGLAYLALLGLLIALRMYTESKLPPNHLF